MKLLRIAGTTSQTVAVEILDSTSTNGAGLTGLAYNTNSLAAYYCRTRSASTLITLNTQTVNGAYASGGFVEIDNTHMKGVYRLDIPDAALAVNADSAVIVLSGAANMVDCRLEIDLAGTILSAASVTGSVNSVNGNVNGSINSISGVTYPTNFSTLSIDANGRVDIGKILGNASAGVAGYVGLDWSHINAPTTTQGLTNTTISSSQVVASVTGAVGSVTGAVGSVSGNVNGSVNSVVGSVGSVTGNVNGNVTGAVGSVTGAVGSVSGNVNGSVNSVVGSVGSVSGNVNGNVTGTVASIINPGNIWDVINTGATHNIPNSTGRQLRSIAPGTDAVIYPLSGTVTLASATSNTATLDSGASAVSQAYQWDVINILAGTGAGQSRIISNYTTGRIATVTPAWTTTPDNTSGFDVTPTASVQVVSYITGQDPATLVLDVAAASHNIASSIGAAINLVSSGNVTINSLSAAALAQFFTVNTTKVYADAIAGSVVHEIAANSGGGSDPWAVTLPGTYSAGQAGFIVGNIADASTIVSDVWAFDLPDSYIAGQAGYIVGNLVDTATLVTDIWSEPVPGAYVSGTAGWYQGHIIAGLGF